MQQTPAQPVAAATSSEGLQIALDNPVRRNDGLLIQGAVVNTSNQVRAIPQDATILLVAGPKSDFFPSEVDLLKTYLAKGGKVLFLLDPREKADSLVHTLAR